jgi:type VI secretion system protein ImpL
MARQLGQTFRPDPTGHVDSGTQKLLEDPITYVLGLIRLLGPAELNGKGKDLCAQVRPIMAKYPFNPNPAAAQATLADFDTIFDPKKGLLWVFYDANLQKLLQRQGSTFTPVSSAGMTMNPAFVAMMNRAAAFTDIAYANAATDPHFTYTVKPEMAGDQDSIKMTIDGQTVEFTSANQSPKQFVWPGAAHGVQASVKYKGGTPQSYPSYDGLWAIFQFVQDADTHTGQLVEMKLKAGKQGKLVTNEATGEPITLRFDINATPPIFDKGYFSGMACVQEVVKEK